MGGDIETRQIQYVTYRLTEPPAAHDAFQFVFNTLEGSTTAESRLWGTHDLAQSNKADVAFVVATYSFPPPAYTPNFRAVTSTGTLRVVGRMPGHVQLELNLSFTDATGSVRTVTGDAQANTEKFAALCN